MFSGRYTVAELFNRIFSRAPIDGEVRALPVTSGLDIPAHDAVEMSYTGDDLTGVVYKREGATVATLTLTYDDGKLVGVERS